MMRYEEIKRLDECDEKEIKELLVGRKVKVNEDTLILDNGIVLEISPNEGCGGCTSGWYTLSEKTEEVMVLKSKNMEINHQITK